jgi:hypothetical protein
MPVRKLALEGLAEGGGDEGVLEQDPLSGDPVHVRRLEKRVAHGTDRVPPIVIRKDDQDIGFGPLGAWSLAR